MAAASYRHQKRFLSLDSIGRLRAIGLLEGIAFLFLLGVAMPLKYLAGIPLAVILAGWLHGILFMAFCVVLTQAHQDAKWSPRQSATVLIAALLPFGPFIIERRLREASDAMREGTTFEGLG